MSVATAFNDRVAKCGGCGAELVFAIGSSRVKVCEFCNYVSVRTPQGIEGQGKVAEVIPTGSKLALGALGKFEGVGFRLAGRVQLSWAQGAWDEWYAAFDDGRWGWIAEAGGRYYVSFRVSQRQVPGLNAMRPGRSVNLRGLGRFVVTDVKVARYVGASGELPEAFPIDGSQVHLIDLSGAHGAFATFDYGDGSDPEPGIFNGHEVQLAALHLDASHVHAERPTARARELTCPHCNAPLELFNPNEAVRVTCTSCGSLLDASDGPLKFVAAMKTPRLKWPLGSEATFEGEKFRVAGWMLRDCNVYGETYSWEEYLLYNPNDGSYRYLMQSDDHWSFVTPVAAGDVESGPGGATYMGKSFKKFSRVLARVRMVWGEFPWAVAKGESVYAIDYIAPPEGLSEERAESEITWSYSRYVTPREVSDAFGSKGTPREPVGVAALQPNPWQKAADGSLRTAMFACAVAAVLFVAFIVRASDQVVLKQKIAFVAGQVLGGEEGLAIPAPKTPTAYNTGVAFSKPFEIPDSGRNLLIELDSDVKNSWVWVSGALVDEVTGEIRAFGLESSYYSGSDSGGSWREDDSDSSMYLSAVPAGKWVLRTEAQWPKGKPGPRVDLTFTSGVVRISHFMLVLFALLAGPIFLVLRRNMFEQSRWEQSTEDDS